jgi:hypothetical protein
MGADNSFFRQGARKPVVFPGVVPQIISVGPPPEQHADRVTAEMIEFIVRLRAAVWAKGEATLSPSAMGNPTSQARRVARLRKLNGALWPFVHLTRRRRSRHGARLCGRRPPGGR